MHALRSWSIKAFRIPIATFDMIKVRYLIVSALESRVSIEDREQIRHGLQSTQLPNPFFSSSLCSVSLSGSWLVTLLLSKSVMEGKENSKEEKDMIGNKEL